MKNKLIDLNNHMFAQLERLSEEGITSDVLAKEIDRSKAITSLAGQIINNADLSLKANIAINEHLIRKPAVMLGLEGYKDEV
jgi:hypothetical protein